MAMAVAVVMTVRVVVAVFVLMTVLVVMHVVMIMYVVVAVLMLMIVHALVVMYVFMAVVMPMMVLWGQLRGVGQHGFSADRSLDFQAWAIAVRVEVGHVGIVVVLLELDCEVTHIEAGLGDRLLFNAKAIEG